MGFIPTTIAAKDYIIANKPILGGEMEVWASFKNMFEMGVVDFVATDSGVQTNDDYNTFATVKLALEVEGLDLAVVVKDQFDASSASAVINFSGTDADAGAQVGAATLAAPGYVANRICSFQTGAAFDIVPTIPTKTWESVGFNGSTGGVYEGGHLRIVALPQESSFRRIACITSIEYASPTRPPVAIPCGMDGAGGGIKPGRTEVPTVTMKAKDRGLADGLARYSGRRCTLMIKTNKEGKAITQKVFLGNVQLNAKPSSGDGNDEATMNVDGMYEQLAAFFAP